MFEDLFPSGRGRPSLPPGLVAAVLVLQALHGLSDREAVEAVTFDLRWKAAVGLAVTDGGVHPTTLTYWRGGGGAPQGAGPGVVAGRGGGGGAGGGAPGNPRGAGSPPAGGP